MCFDFLAKKMTIFSRENILFNVSNLMGFMELHIFVSFVSLNSCILICENIDIFFLENSIFREEILETCVRFLFLFFAICKFISNAYLDLKKRDDIFFIILSCFY